MTAGNAKTSTLLRRHFRCFGSTPFSPWEV